MFGISVLAIKYKQKQRSANGKYWVFSIIKLARGALLKERNEVKQPQLNEQDEMKSEAEVKRYQLCIQSPKDLVLRNCLKGCPFNTTAW